MPERYIRLALFRRNVNVALALFIGFALSAGQAAAQDIEERFPGVSLGLTFESRSLPNLAIQPFTGRMGGQEQAAQLENIIARDLRNSSRFRVMDAVPASLAGDQVDYALWDQIDATWLVTGRVEGAGSSSVLILELHDVVYREVVGQQRITIPNVQDSNFRMTAHTVSDQIVWWAFEEPGIAATRIVFSRKMEDQTQDLWIVDSDGENLRRLTSHRGGAGGSPLSMTPVWSEDGRRVAYISTKDTGVWRIYEMNLATGAEKMVPASLPGDYITPEYHPDDERIFFGISNGTGRGIYSYNIAEECCFQSVLPGRTEEFSPTFSPDGRLMAFNSFRLGEAHPQIYMMDASGSGRPELVSPYEYNVPGFYTSPNWSPTGDRIVYQGWVRNRGNYQILVAELDSRFNVLRTVQVTDSGVNEDASFAPDGRHVVHTGERSYGFGLFITDVETGNTRTLVSGIEPNPPSWSPSLATMRMNGR